MKFHSGRVSGAPILSAQNASRTIDASNPFSIKASASMGQKSKDN
jgi:hypothetical protein